MVLYVSWYSLDGCSDSRGAVAAGSAFPCGWRAGLVAARHCRHRCLDQPLYRSSYRCVNRVEGEKHGTGFESRCHVFLSLARLYNSRYFQSSCSPFPLFFAIMFSYVTEQYTAMCVDVRE